FGLDKKKVDEEALFDIEGAENQVKRYQALKDKKDLAVFKKDIKPLPETSASKLARARNLKAFGAELKAKYKGKDVELMNENQKRLLAKDLVVMEEKIVNNVENEAVRGAIRFFNKYAKTDYMYVWKTTPGKYYGTNEKAEKV
ncbi:unnamed protein product, partial [marine sediment metagenome]